MDEKLRSYLSQPSVDPGQKPRISSLQHPASENDLHFLIGEAKAMYRGAYEGDDLRRLLIDDVGSDVIRLGCLENERRELAELARRDSPPVYLSGELARRRTPEVLRPSSLRAAAPTAASPTAPAPSIASPLIAPSEGKRT
jgi:hypothetical protein